VSKTVFCENWLFEATGVTRVLHMAREQLYSKSTEDTTRSTAVLHLSALYVFINILLLFPFPIACVTLFYMFVSVCQKIIF